MEEAVRIIINTLSLGSLYSLLALGLALIFGIMGLVNFAHGDLLMISGYTVVGIQAVSPGTSWAILAIAAIAAAVLASVLMERVAFRPLRRAADASTMLVASFAVSSILESGATTGIGTLAKPVSTPSFASGTWILFGVPVSRLTVLTMIASILLLGGVHLFLTRSSIGVQMRAAAENTSAARLIGVRATRVVISAFAASGVLAGVAGVILVMTIGSVTPTMGQIPILVAFVATVIGGMRSLLGAVLGAFLLALCTTVPETLLTGSAQQFTDSFVYGGVFLLLLFLPNGLLSPNRRMRVV